MAKLYRGKVWSIDWARIQEPPSRLRYVRTKIGPARLFSGQAGISEILLDGQRQGLEFEIARPVRVYHTILSSSSSGSSSVRSGVIPAALGVRREGI